MAGRRRYEREFVPAVQTCVELLNQLRPPHEIGGHWSVEFGLQQGMSKDFMECKELTMTGLKIANLNILVYKSSC